MAQSSPLSLRRARALLDRIAGLKLLVVGDAMLDHYVWGDATRLSPEAPVPVVEVGRDTYVPGGAANVAANARALGATTTLAAAIADDAAGLTLRDQLRHLDIALVGPSRPVGATITKTRVLVQHQQLCRLDREAAPADYAWPIAAAKPKLAAAIATSDAVLISDYAKGFVTAELVATVTALAGAAGKPVALDPKPKHPLPFAGIGLLTPNRAEAFLLAALSPTEANAPFPAEAVCAEIFARTGVSSLAITLGADGILLAQSGRVVGAIPTAAREVFDVSGAGDTTICALVLAVAAGASLIEAAHLANAAAGVVVAKIGTATVTPTELLAQLVRRA